MRRARVDLPLDDASLPLVAGDYAAGLMQRFSALEFE
jgi:hypothetical protein